MTPPPRESWMAATRRKDTVDAQLSFFAPAPVPTPAVRRTRCQHVWMTHGIELRYCLKCGKAFLNVDGIQDERAWPLPNVGREEYRTMHAPRRKHSPDTLVRLSLGKGVLVILTMSEYSRALRRGKAERRVLRRQAHLARQQAQA